MDPIAFLIENGAPKGRGKPPARVVHMAHLRDLDESDLPDLLDPPPQPPATVIARLRQRHHAAARLLAEGRKVAEVAMITGYQPGRISALQADPAFIELIHYYSSQVDAVYVSVHERLAALSESAVGELQDRLEETPEKFSVRELKELAELALDRTGFAPKGNGGGSGTTPVGPSVLNISFVTPENTQAVVTLDGEALGS